MRLLAFLVLLLGAIVAPLDASKTNTIHIDYVDCGSSPTLPLRIKVLDLLNKAESLPQYTVKPTALGFAVNLQMKPGFYSLMIDHDKCGGYILLPVLAGRDQNVSLIGLSGIVLTESNLMVAGSLPLRGYRASIVYYPQDQTGDSGPTSLAVDPARVEGDSYYATGLAQGTARLRISNADGTHWLEFKLGVIGPKDRRFILFNLTQRDIENAANAPVIVRTPSPR